MTPECPQCGSELEPDTFSIDVLVTPRDFDGPTVPVHGLECYWCARCESDPSFPDQIRRNHERIAKARAAFEVTGDRNA